MSAAAHQTTPSPAAARSASPSSAPATSARQYLDNLTVFPDLKVHVIADLFEEAAAARAKEYGIPEWGGVDAALNHPDVEIIVNLTIPAAHVEVATAAVERRQARLDREAVLPGPRIRAGAAEGGRRRGHPPGLRTGHVPGRRAADGPADHRTRRHRHSADRHDHVPDPGPGILAPESGLPLPARRGPALRHGPVLPVTALVQTFGSVAQGGGRRVQGQGRPRDRFRAQGGRGVRRRGAHPCVAMAQFEGGASSHSVFSFESPRQRMGFVEITGTEATIALPDPNYFDGDVRLWRAGATRTGPSSPPTAPTNGRGMGVLDMARSIRAGVPHRATGRPRLPRAGHHGLDLRVHRIRDLRRRRQLPPRPPRPSPRTGTPPPPPSRNHP